MSKLLDFIIKNNMLGYKAYLDVKKEYKDLPEDSSYEDIEFLYRKIEKLAVPAIEELESFLLKEVIK